MTSFTVHDENTAPESARPVMLKAAAMFGFVPNLIGVMAESPELAEGYLALTEVFSRTGLTPVEQQVVLLAVSHQNECRYCVAAHGMIAEMVDVPAAVVEALHAGEPLPDARLEVLRRFTVSVVHSRGWPPEQELEGFLAAGYERRHVFDVILGVGMKTLSNYTNHIAETPLDAQFSRAPEGASAAG